MQFLYFGDRHYDETIPESRIGNYLVETRLKDEEIQRLGAQYDVTAFLHPGDFLDKSKLSITALKDIITFWTGATYDETSTILKGSKKPLIGVYGNHDLIGGDYATRHNTMMGLMESLGLCQMATKEAPIVFTLPNGKTVAITGTSYHTGMDRKKYLSDYVIDQKQGDYHIHIVHGMLTAKSVGSLYHHTTIDEICHTKADLTLCGHDHLGFGVISRDGKIFANNGAVVRRTNSLKEISRTPSVLLITIDDAGLSVKELPLLSAKPGNQVLSREKIERVLREKAMMTDFKEKTDALGLVESCDIKAILEDLAKKEGIAPAIKNDLLVRIKEKEAKEPSPPTAKTHLFIKTLTLENFLIHKHTTFNFSKGLNILVGESRQGKSTVLRAIEWVYENKVSGKGRSFIRAGADYAKVSLELSDGTIIVRHATAKTSGANGYTIYYPDGTEKKGNTQLLEEVQQIVGYSYFIVDKDFRIPLNLLKQGSSWFLIGDKYSPADRAKIIGALSGTQYADAVRRDFDKEKTRLKDDLKKGREASKQLSAQLDTFSYLPDLANTIASSEAALSHLQTLTTTYEALKTLTSQRQALILKKEKLEAVLTKVTLPAGLDQTVLKTKEGILQHQALTNQVKQRQMLCDRQAKAEVFINASSALTSAKKAYEQLVLAHKSQSELSKELTLYMKNNKAKGAAEGFLVKTEHLTVCKEAMQILKQQLMTYEDLQKGYEIACLLQQKIQKTTQQIAPLDKLLMQTGEVKTLLHHFETLQGRVLAKDTLHQLSARYHQSALQVKTLSAQIETATNTLNQSLSAYTLLLEEAGSCPVCHSTIDQKAIRRLLNNLYPKGDVNHVN